MLKIIAEISGPLIIAGPGFVKDDFVRYARNKNSAPAGRAIVVETRRIGKGAVQDVIGTGTLEKLIGDIQLSREVKLMDEVLLRISRDGAVAYGKQQVASAIEYGAVDEVLLADTQLRNKEIMHSLSRLNGCRQRSSSSRQSLNPVSASRHWAGLPPCFGINWRADFYSVLNLAPGSFPEGVFRYCFTPATLTKSSRFEHCPTKNPVK